MKKTVYVTLSFMVVALLSGCTPKTSEPVINKPVISGVSEETSIHLGETYNALLGVSASDIEDGDLTSKISLTSTPALINNNGVLLPDSQGDYYLIYSVTDSDNYTTEAYATLTVSGALPVETLYSSLELEETRSFSLHDWELAVDELAEATLVDEDELSLVISEPGATRESVMFSKVFANLSKDTNYTFEFLLKGVDVNVQILVDSQNGELALSEEYALTAIGEVNTFEFSLENDETAASVSLLFGNDLSGAETSLVISSVKLSYEDEDGEGVVLINDDFTAATTDWSFNAFDGAEATISQEEGFAFNIDKYASDNKPWNINLFRVSEVVIKAGGRYRVLLEVNSTANQFFELCIEDKDMDWKVRAGFLNGTLEVGENTIDFTFTASQDISGIYLKLALGEGSADTNKLTINSLVFSELTTVITNDVFAPSYSKPDWEVFNTDGGEGNASGASGEIVYTITTFGEVDWHNKIAFENIELAAMAKYRFEVTLAVTQTISAQVIINESGVWNPFYNEKTIFQGGEEKVITFTLDAPLFEAKTVDFLLQFGGFSENEAPTTITISSVTIYAIK